MLVVDATQGVEAQTLANTYLALEHDLELVPVLNKIDLPSAHPDEVAQEVEDVIGLPCLDAPRDLGQDRPEHRRRCSSEMVSDIPAPTGDPDAPLRALIFDSITTATRASSSTSASSRAPSSRRHHPADGHRCDLHGGGGRPHGRDAA